MRRWTDVRAAVSRGLLLDAVQVTARFDTPGTQLAAEIAARTSNPRLGDYLRFRPEAMAIRTFRGKVGYPQVELSLAELSDGSYASYAPTLRARIIEEGPAASRLEGSLRVEELSRVNAVVMAVFCVGAAVGVPVWLVVGFAIPALQGHPANPADLFGPGIFTALGVFSVSYWRAVQRFFTVEVVRLGEALRDELGAVLEPEG